MKIAILSDIHAQYANLLKVLEDAASQGCTEYWCLGDFVGRGENPAEVLLKMKEVLGDNYLLKSVSGNHDMMVRRDMDVDMFFKDLEKDGDSGDKITSVSGTSATLVDMANRHRRILQTNGNQKLLDWLHKLKPHAEPVDHFYITHGAYVLRNRRPDAPMMYREYTWSMKSIANQLGDLQKNSRSNTPYLLAVGHTHVSGLWQLEKGQRLPQMIWGWDRITHKDPLKNRSEVFFHEIVLKQVDENPVYINPGSVGFPRHHDNHPTYAVLNIHDQTTLGIEFREVQTGEG